MCCLNETNSTWFDCLSNKVGDTNLNRKCTICLQCSLKLALWERPGNPLVQGCRRVKGNLTEIVTSWFACCQESETPSVSSLHCHVLCVWAKQSFQKAKSWNCTNTHVTCRSNGRDNNVESERTQVFKYLALACCVCCVMVTEGLTCMSFTRKVTLCKSYLIGNKGFLQVLRTWLLTICIDKTK